MAVRFGRVLYWLGCGLAVLFGFGALHFSLLLTTDYLGGCTQPGVCFNYGAILAILAVGSWLLGRALRYILAGT